MKATFPSMSTAPLGIPSTVTHSVCKQRPPESLNNHIKDLLGPNRRVPVIGHPRMRIHLLFVALYINVRATIARILRTGQQLPFTT